MQTSLLAWKRIRLDEPSKGEDARASMRAGVSVELAPLGQQRLRALQERLRFKPRSGFIRNETPEPILAYRLTETSITVPRCTRLEGMHLEDNLCDGKPMAPDAVFVGVVQRHQEDPIVKSLACLNATPWCCILTLPCGFGKTVVALNLACALGRKTIVVVHKTFLMEQWSDRISSFVPGARIGRLQGKVIDVEDKDVVVATVQSLSLCDYGCSVLDDFGTVIIDEAHHMAARMFSEIFFRLPARYLLGLTATPDRKDGCGSLLNLYMGPFSFLQQSRPGDERVAVARVLAGTCTPSLAGDVDNAMVQRLKSRLVKDERRNLQILEWCRSLTYDHGRCVLVLSHRVKHLHLLLARYQGAGDLEGCLFVGGQKKKDRVAAEQSARCIFGTFAMAAEGLDISRVDTLILAMPQSDVVQSVGRILRPGENKKTPLVVDLLDSHCQIFKIMNQTRQNFFRAQGYEMRDFEMPPPVGDQHGWSFIRDGAPVIRIIT